MEREPNTFECLQNPSPGKSYWHSCSKTQICNKYGPEHFGTHFRPIKSDPEYLDNWVEKLNLLCETHSNIGFLGSSYFIGMIMATTFVPPISDIYGRKSIYCTTMFFSVICQYMLITSDNLYTSTVWMFVLGLTWPGKRVTGLNYALEFIPVKMQGVYV